MGTGALPSPLSHFMAQVDELRASGIPDMDAIGRLLTELAADDEFFAPLIAGMPPASMDVHWLARPERGPRLVLVHRPEGVMAYTHSHGCWVGIAPVQLAETHQHWNVVRHESGRAELSLAGEHVLHRGDVATLVPPRDVHNHGHVIGTGPAPYSLILDSCTMTTSLAAGYFHRRGSVAGAYWRYGDNDSSSVRSAGRRRRRRRGRRPDR